MATGSATGGECRAGELLVASLLPSGADGRSVDVADGWAQKGRDGRVFHVARQGEAFHALSRHYATTSGFANPLPVSRQHLYALYFLIR